MPQSSDITDQAWDAFVARSPLGQFQQTSGWARVKEQEGWRLQRILVNPQSVEEGGLQLLWKPTRLGKMGYASKGPILPEETPGAIDHLLTRAKLTAKELGIRAVMVQPPDDSVISENDMVRHGFFASPVGSVIRATAVVDVCGGRNAIMEQIGKKSRWEVRQAEKQGVTARLGSRADIPLFFSLMEETCRRQSTKPNPRNADALLTLWDVFLPRVLIGFASHNGKTIAGVLLLGQGKRMTLWKKGWNSRDPSLFANRFLNVAALQWAAERGYSKVDFAGIDPALAERRLAGAPLTSEQERSRDVFHLRLGAKPQLVPPARMLVINPAVRSVIGSLLRWRRLERLALHRL
jgi:lipid II:glycine glycyltransferase (peptidoglycan interpeptide bridge formation enzyme)